MATLSAPFYGCLCLETSSNKNNQPAAQARQAANIPLPEIHFNIWEEGINSEPFLDVGFMLSVDDPAERIEIFLPWVLENKNIVDLSSRILHANGVSAVFNEAWTTSASTNNPGGYVTRADGTVFTIVPYTQPVINTNAHNSGSLHSIVFDIKQLRLASDAAAMTASKPPGHMYVRIRIKGVPQTFYRVGIDQRDAFGGGSLNRTEIIDFRLNVRRGVPPAIESFLNGRFLEFSKVQLFLMKSRSQDIVFEDKLFKACRSLEDEKFWVDYILPQGASSKNQDKCRKHVQASLGYQWKSSSSPNQSPVTEFGMLARFKSFKMQKRTIGVFVLVAILLGMIGNGAYDLTIWVFSSKAIPSESIDPVSMAITKQKGQPTDQSTSKEIGK